VRPLLCAFSLFSLLVFAQCGRKKPVAVVRAFYYWKVAEWSGINYESSQVLARLKAGKLYVKMFEVEPSSYMGPIPVSKSLLRSLPYRPDSALYAQEIVPVIFIRDEALKGLSPQGVDSLADNINFLTGKYVDRMQSGGYAVQERYLYRELQLDCDWSEKNQNTFFSLIRAVKAKSGKEISCTLRLYPFKYRDRMGIPPADRAMLMCYNLLNPVANMDKNTILSTKELEAYLGRKKDYPLPLDIALPAYAQARLYRYDHFEQTLHIDDAAYASVLKHVKPYWYEVLHDTSMGGAYVRAGDMIKYESVSTADLLKTVELLRSHITLPDTVTVAYFHLDENLLNRYSYETLDSVYRSFGR
jgi:hypothetical protein